MNIKNLKSQVAETPTMLSHVFENLTNDTVCIIRLNPAKTFMINIKVDPNKFAYMEDRQYTAESSSGCDITARFHYGPDARKYLEKCVNYHQNFGKRYL